MKNSKNKSLLEKFIKEERANAKIVEYSVILPICLFIFAMLFLSGYYLNQRAVLDAAVNRGVVLAQKVYGDPNADALFELGLEEDSRQVGTKCNSATFTSGELKSDPYRYLLKGSSKFDKIYNIIETRIKNSVKTSQLIGLDNRLSELKIDMPRKFKGFVSYKMTVTLTQEFKNPFVPKLLGDKMGSWFSMESSATASVMSVSEFIRTTDMVNDVVERFSGNDAGGWVTKLMDKVMSFINITGSKKEKTNSDKDSKTDGSKTDDSKPADSKTDDSKPVDSKPEDVG